MLAATENFAPLPLPRLSQKPHLGHQLPTAILYPGIGFAISNTATGLANQHYDSRVRPRCTSKERDAETGLDYFQARYFSSAQGRFTSPDEFTGGAVDPFTGRQVSQPGPLPYADIFDPQTLNKYGYVRNNPLRYVDPDGHAGTDTALDVAIEEVDKVVRPLIESAGNAAGRATATGFGLLSRAAGVAGAFFTFAVPAGGQDEVVFEASIKSKQQQNKQEAEEKEPATEKELQPSTSGAGARKGGGRDIRQSTKESTTLEGSQTRREDISKEQAGKRKQGRGEAIRSIEKTKQRERHQLDRVKKLEDVNQ